MVHTPVGRGRRGDPSGFFPDPWVGPSLVVGVDFQWVGLGWVVALPVSVGGPFSCGSPFPFLSLSCWWLCWRRWQRLGGPVLSSSSVSGDLGPPD